MCLTENCKNILYCKNLCKTCYHRGYANKNYNILTTDKKIKCVVDNCNRRKYAKGYCAIHHKQLKTNTDYITMGLKKCKIPECNIGITAKGYCSKHYQTSVLANENIKNRLNQNKYKAKKNNLEWNISLNDYFDLVNKPCYYCQGPINKTGKGLDRIDNSKGYFLENVLPCCSDCNYLRGIRLSVKETTEIVELLKKLRDTNNIWKKDN